MPKKSITVSLFRSVVVSGVELFAPATTANSNKNPIVTGVLQPPHDDGISFVGGGCNTPPTKEIHPLPLQEFAPATNWIPNEIPIEYPIWNSHGCRSKLFDSAHRIAPATAKAIWNRSFAFNFIN